MAELLKHVWRWLGSNSSQVQALAGLVVAVVAAVVGWVALKQKQAAREQVEAAKSQIEASENQAVATREQAETVRKQYAASSKQSEANLFVADLQAAPYIAIEAAKNRDGGIVSGVIWLINKGGGPASHITVTYDNDKAEKNTFLVNDEELGVGDYRAVRLTDAERAAQDGIRVVYDTIFGTKYALTLKWNSQAAKAHERKTERLSSMDANVRTLLAYAPSAESYLHEPAALPGRIEKSEKAEKSEANPKGDRAHWA